MKFTQRGKVTIRGFVEQNMFVFEVSDTGLGISEEQLPVIFDSFKQGDSTSTRKQAEPVWGLLSPNAWSNYMVEKFR